MHEILLCVLWYPVGMWWLEWFVPFPFNALIVAAVFQLYIAAKLSDDRDLHRAYLQIVLGREAIVLGFGLFFSAIRYILL